MNRILYVLGSLSAVLAVAAGAFGAHALRERLDPARLAAFETGARYQMYHALGLLLVAWGASQWPGTLWAWAGGCLVAGTVLFCGSLYTLSLSGQLWPGVLTPLGGACFLAGWLLAALAAWRAVP